MTKFKRLASHPYSTARLLAIALLALAAVSGCTILPPNVNQVESYAFTDTQDTSLAVAADRHLQKHPDEDAFMLLQNGIEAFVARAVLAQRAERSLDVQYYAYHNDLIGKLFTTLLWQAAERGVRVRLLVDDWAMEAGDKGIIAFDSHPNIEVRVFNPLNPTYGRLPQVIFGLGTVTRRMHNKSFTADNAMAILGGRNIGDEYYNANPDIAFADLDVVAIGDVVQDVSHTFDTYWNSISAYPVTTFISERPDDKEKQALIDKLLAFSEQQEDSSYIRALLSSPLYNDIQNQKEIFYPGDATVLADHPDKIINPRSKKSLHLTPKLLPYFDAVDKNLFIVSPYFVPGKEGVEFLSGIAERGVRVQVLTNSLASNDIYYVHAGYSKYRKALLRNGVEIYELNKKLAENTDRSTVSGFRAAALHAKTFLLDDDHIFVGSLNLDPRSFNENTEIGLVINNRDITSQVKQEISNNLEQTSYRLELVEHDDGTEALRWHGYDNGQPVSYRTEPHTTFWQRFGIGLLKLLPIESQL